MGRRRRQGAAAKDAIYSRQINIPDLTRMHSVSSFYGGAPKASAAEMLNEDDAAPIETNDRGGSFADGFFATLQRTMQQKWRDPFVTALELIIPLIFIIGTIILSAVFGHDKHAASNMFSYTNIHSAALPDYYKQMLCSNSSSSPIEGLVPCTQSNFQYSCDGDESDIPVTGLCYDTTLGGDGVLAYYLNSLTGPISMVPPLDTIIIHQWLAKKVIGYEAASLAAAAALTTTGVAGNTRYNSILSSGMLYFAPAANVPAGLLEYFGNQSVYFRYVNGGVFATLKDAEDRVRAHTTNNWAIVELRSYSQAGFDVVLHLNHSALPDLTAIVDVTYPGGFQFNRAELYMASGFSSLQKLVYDYYLANYVPTNGTTKLDPYFVSFGSPEYDRSMLLDNATSLVAFILVLSFLYPVTQLAKKNVLEKELRIHEAVLIMGLNNSALYLSWFVVYALQYFLFCLIAVLLLKVTYVTKSNAMVLFLAYYLFALTTIPLSGIIAAFFSKARLVSMLAPLIFFTLSVPIFAFTNATPAAIIGTSILSPTAFASLLTSMLTYETSTGFTAGDLHADDFSPQPYILFIMMFAEFVIYYVLMIYLDAVIPKDWGVSKNPFFFITEPIRYCCGGRKMLEGGPDGRDPNGVFEDVNDEDAAVRIEGLRKVYRRNGHHFAAVDNLYWSLREKEISVLLGHNGAGKTTVMNMMTGMTAPDEGDCYVYGYSVRTQLQKVRQLIGFCPQHNILWPELTCREHLEYFGRIKGLKGTELEEAVRMILDEVDLAGKVNQPSRALSGGQKRKLSIAIAFVGRSPLVFLDEPTAGLDVGARRQVWELLKRMAQSHTILLTTHYMDEADLLGHRIGIMSQGRLKCNGSSVFLKSRLGVGYHLSISLAPDAEAAAVDALITNLVPSANVANFTGSEILYKLPMSDVNLFPDLLAGLEERGEANGVRGYSLSATTLEEVFLQVAMEDFGDGAIDIEDGSYDLIWQCGFYSSSGAHSRSQLRAMMTKRWWSALRDRRMQCFQIICPVVCILLAMLFTLVKYSKTGTVELSANMFDDPTEMEISHCHRHFGGGPMNLSNTRLVDHNFVSGLDLSSYVIDTFKGHPQERYASIYCDDPNLGSIIPNASSVTFLFYNTSAYHSVGMVMSQLYSLALQHATANPNNVMRTEAHSLPAATTDVKTQNGVQTILIGAIVMTPFTFLPSNPVAWIVKERQTKARHLQDISGLRFHVYWISNFIFDFCCYIVTMLLAIIIFAIFNRKEYISSETIGPTIVSFVVYGFTSTVASYAISFAFKEYSSAQTITMAVSFVLGFLLVMMVFILSLVDFTKDASDKMRWAFRIIPSYCIGECIINLAVNAQRVQVNLGLSPWSMGVVGWPCVYMSAEFPFFALFTLLFDHPRRRLFGQRSSYNREAPSEVIEDEDSDVEDERLAVYEQEAAEENEDIVRVVDLRKVYGNGTVAVRNLTFSILPDEVFGFLGTNGAGKTTTISILCQEFLPTSGSAYVCGYDVVEYSGEALQCIGYCPQFDATLDLLTVEEHLYMYAGIRGIVDDQRKTIVDGLMRVCDIDEYRNTTSSKLSGGNRRKLSVAISLIGAPQVVFLDEPSAGMDPVARRALWTAITKVAENCSIVLTTHHLEEVEALANTVAIMANGALRCIGDKIHLKQKYGSGFEMSLRVSDPSVRHIVNDFVEENFPNAVLNEYKGHRFVYALPPDTRLSETFHILQMNKQRFGITDYSVSQTSIEQVFLRISEQEDIKSLMPGYEAGAIFGPSHAALRGYHGNSTARRRYEREDVYSSPTTAEYGDDNNSSSDSSASPPYPSRSGGYSNTYDNTPSPWQPESSPNYGDGVTMMRDVSPYGDLGNGDDEVVFEQEGDDEGEEDDSDDVEEEERSSDEENDSMEEEEEEDEESLSEDMLL